MMGGMPGGDMGGQEAVCPAAEECPPAVPVAAVREEASE